MDFRTDPNARKSALRKLLVAVRKHEKDIIAALAQDLGKPEFESIATETAYVISDLKNTIAKMDGWIRPRRVLPSVINFPSVDRIYREPYGDVLIISPWNYPFQLALCPLIAAVAAGNRVVLKPSELAPNTASVIELITAQSFDPVHVEVFHGGAEVSARLLERKWDYIFFTGSVRVGRIVAEAAARNLTPVTLELGGKNPCIVDQTANLELAARRICWGKFLNAGQTCIAPDHVLAHESIKPRLMQLLQKEIVRAYGDDPKNSPDFARIVDAKNHERLLKLLEGETIYFGGNPDASAKYMPPTLVDGARADSILMEEEIFGPILPVIGYADEGKLPELIARHPQPLSLYVFTQDQKFAGSLMRSIPFGGGCINDTMVHFANRRLPFGGIGTSGQGAYHGKLGYETFSHRKAILRRGTWMDVRLRYPPYGKKAALIKRILEWI